MPVSDSADFPTQKALVHERWHAFLEVLSWWELKRYFKRQGNTVILTPEAYVVVAHPVGRLLGLF